MSFIFLSKPPEQAVCASLKVGDAAPILQSRSINPSLFGSETFTLVVFLRHVGCPFAEHMVKEVRSWSNHQPNIPVVMISHGDELATNKWLDSIGGKGGINLIIDPSREIYGSWGLGYSNLLHFLGPRSLLAVVSLLFKGVKNRSAAGTRFQKSAMFLVKSSKIVWHHVPLSAQEINFPANAFLK
jgi:hypothetical protein